MIRNYHTEKYFIREEAVLKRRRTVGLCPKKPDASGFFLYKKQVLRYN